MRDGKRCIVVPSYADGYNLVGGHGIPVRLAILRGVQEALREARTVGALAEDYLDLYALWCGLEVLHHVVARKKLKWGTGQGARPPTLLMPRQPLRRWQSPKSARSGGDDLLSLVPWDLRQLNLEEVHVPRRLASLRRRAHDVLFHDGPAIDALSLHAGILRELHTVYRQPWTPQDEAEALRRLARNQAVKIGERDLHYRPRDLALVLAYYGLGHLAPIKGRRSYQVRYWDVELLSRLQARPGPIDLRSIPWMRDRYVLAADLAA